MQKFTVIRRYFYILSLPLFLNGCATGVDCSQPIFNGITTAPPPGCGSGKPPSSPSASSSPVSTSPLPASASASSPAATSPTVPEENLSGKQMVERGENLLREGQAKIDEGRRLIAEGKKMLRESEQGIKTIK